MLRDFKDFKPSETVTKLAVGLLYVISIGSFINGALSSIYVMFTGQPENPVWGYTWGDALEDWIGVGVSLTCVFSGLWLIARNRGTSYHHVLNEAGLTMNWSWRWWRSFFVRFFLYMGVHFLASGMKEFLPNSWFFEVTPHDIPTEYTWSFFTAVITAGPHEEITLIAFTFLALANLGLKKPWIFAIAVMLRMSFHLYYGPGAAITYSLWAAGIIMVWMYTKNIWGQTIAHSTANGLVVLHGTGGYTWAETTNIILHVIGLVIVIVSCKRLAQRYDQKKKEAATI